MARTRKKNTPNLKKILPIIVVILVVVGVAWFILSRHSTPKPSVSKEAGQVNLEPATKDDQTSNDTNKEAIIDRDTKIESNQPTQGSGKRQVNVVVTSATGSAVRGYVDGVFEEGGTCTATVTNGSQTFTKTSSGFANASYTQCSPINWDSQLPAGKWSLTLSYSSDTASGTITKTVEVE